MQYLYNDGELYYFMDPETYDQVPVAFDLVEDALSLIHISALSLFMSYCTKSFIRFFLLFHWPTRGLFTGFDECAAFQYFFPCDPFLFFYVARLVFCTCTIFLFACGALDHVILLNLKPKTEPCRKKQLGVVTNKLVL